MEAVKVAPRVRQNRTVGSLSPYRFEVRNPNHRVSVPHVMLVVVMAPTKVRLYNEQGFFMRMFAVASAMSFTTAWTSRGRGVARGDRAGDVRGVAIVKARFEGLSLLKLLLRRKAVRFLISRGWKPLK